MMMEEVAVLRAPANGNGRNESGKKMIQMKFVYLPDLHIGKRANELPILEDQKYILKETPSIIGQEKPDGVLIAGDVHDKPVPPVEAVQVFDALFISLVGRNMPAFVISGNYDSPEYLAFGAQFMAGRGIYISPVFDGHVESVRMNGQYGSVSVYMLPFVKPAAVRRCYPDRETETFDHAVRYVLENITGEGSSADEQSILMVHQFVMGALACDSEELSIGGLERVSADLFRDFDYVVLGHIHGPQKIGRETMRCRGTPLKYSFPEAGHKKSVTVVELFEKGNVSVSVRPLYSLHDMREIKGSYSQATDRGSYAGTVMDDYLHITLTGEEDTLDATGKLRFVYSNVMKLNYDNWRTRAGQTVDTTREVHKSPMGLFEELYELQNNQPMSGKQEEYSRKLMGGIWEDMN